MNKLTSVFHFNIMYSSIEVEDRPKLIEASYLPLLKLIKKNNIKVGIEMPGFTLEEIKKLSEETFLLLKELIDNGIVEFIGSGYHQIVMPMWPSKVNRTNLKEGDKVYKELLGIKPTILYVNEQAFSYGLVPLIKKVGYEALIIDSFMAKKDIKESFMSKCSRLSQKVINFPIIWNDTRNFQSFQKYVHGDIDLDTYMNIIDSKKFTMFYGSDVECFNFRPRSGMHSADLEYNEMERIDLLFNRIKDKTTFIKPIIKRCKDACNFDEIVTSDRPIIAKKQGKYNINRWAVCGKNNLFINTLCYSLLSNLKKIEKKHLILFASDFRTNITQKRLTQYLCYFSKFPFPEKETDYDMYKSNEKSTMKYNINEKKGATLKYIKTNGVNIRTFLPYGYFKEQLADFFTGHSYVYKDGKKYTDLMKVDKNENNNYVFNDSVKTYRHTLNKLSIYNIFSQSVFDNATALRAPILTFALDKPFEYYSVTNGGVEETFTLNENFNMAKPIDNHLSSTTGVCCTSGILRIGNSDEEIVIHFNKGLCYSQQLLEYYMEGDKDMLRIHNSLLETDETSNIHYKKIEQPIILKIDITARKRK